VTHEGPDPLGSPRVRALAMDIAFRLRPICGHLPEGELVKLATRLAVAQNRSGSPSTSPPGDRPSSLPPLDAA
jgi:hypothetical protein